KRRSQPRRYGLKLAGVAAMAVKQPSARRDAARRSRPEAARRAPKASDVRRSASQQPPRRILVIDIGGTKLKVLVNGETKPRKIDSGKRMTPARMVEAVRKLTDDWQYEAISIGFPGLVGDSGPRSEPRNLGPGWVGF